jgi:hypothetical protein
MVKSPNNIQDKLIPQLSTFNYSKSMMNREVLLNLFSEEVFMSSSKCLFSYALIGGLCLASFHFFWVIIVYLGFAQPLLDFIFKLHMLNSPFIVQPFSLVLAVQLIIITFLIGAFYGAIFSVVRKLFSK